MSRTISAAGQRGVQLILVAVPGVEKRVAQRTRQKSQRDQARTSPADYRCPIALIAAD
jgi:hypothetical protein